jgi:DNA polymerase-1
MNRIVFDIEANGLNELVLNQKGDVFPEVTKIHCLVAMDVDTEEVFTFGPCEIEEGIKLLKNATILIGHNIISYDLAVLNRLYGESVASLDVIDTLIVSRLMYPDKSQHPLGGNSLACWGSYLQSEKMEYSGGWEAFSEEMLTYCIQDVKVNREIFLHQEAFIKEHEKTIQLEHILSKILSEQTENGFGFNLIKARDLYSTLDEVKIKIERYFADLFPPIVEERFSDKTGKRLKDKITLFNPGSRKQIADRLQSKYGWKPPVTEKGNPKVDEAVLRSLPYEEAKILVRYFNDIKLMGQVSDWINRAENSRDGRIHGSINPQGTVTGRMTASQPNLQQVSSDKRARALFVPREDWVEVGIDASGLEARMLANHMAEYDNGDYGKAVVNGDVHDTNQKAAGLPTRDKAKTFFYGFIYGAGDAKIGKIVNQSAAAGKRLKTRFLKQLPALKKVIDKCKFQVNKDGSIKLLDGRKVPCRSIHAALNVQLQGDGAIIMKLAQCIFHRKIRQKGLSQQAKFMATVHDEWQVECEPQVADLVGKLGIQSIEEAGVRLSCVVPLEGTYKIGKNWAECH